MEAECKKDVKNKLSEALNVLERLESKEEICFTLENKINIATKELSSRKLSVWGVLAIIDIVIGIIICAFFLLGFIILLVLSGGYVEGVLVGVLFGSPYIIMLICSITMLILSFIHFISKKKKNEGIRKELKYLKDEFKREKELLDEIISENYSKIEVIPEKYRYTYAVRHFLEYLDSMRADDMKDAINLYEEEMHRLRMELGQQEILALQQQQYRLSECIENYSRTAVVLSAVNTVANISSVSSHGN